MLKRIVASREQQGGNCRWVLDRFPIELHACRKRHAKTQLIVVIDADFMTVDERLTELKEKVGEAKLEKLEPSEPVVFLIPKRNIETWILALNEEEVFEDEDYKKKSKATDRSVINSAAAKLHDLILNKAPDHNCIASLRSSLPEWQKIS